MVSVDQFREGPTTQRSTPHCERSEGTLSHLCTTTDTSITAKVGTPVLWSPLPPPDDQLPAPGLLCVRVRDPKPDFFPRQNLTQTNSHDPTASHLCPEKTPCTPPTSSCPPPASSCPVPTSCNLPRCSCHKFAPHCIAVLLLPVHRNKIGAKVTLQICLETI